MPTTTVNKGLYKKLYDLSCRGMGRQRVSSSRYSLILTSLSPEKWAELCRDYGVSKKDINDFFLGARGEYPRPLDQVQYALSASEILPGEIMQLNFMRDDSTREQLRLLKLDSRDYLALNSCNPIERGQTVELRPAATLRRNERLDVPSIGAATIIGIYFEQPSPYHYCMDAALLPRYSRTKVTDTLTPLYRKLKEVAEDNIDRDELDTLLAEVAATGISLYSVRNMLDTITDYASKI